MEPLLLITRRQVGYCKRFHGPTVLAPASCFPNRHERQLILLPNNDAKAFVVLPRRTCVIYTEDYTITGPQNFADSEVFLRNTLLLFPWKNALFIRKQIAHPQYFDVVTDNWQNLVAAD
ncbi:hypothetical protein PsorP6_007927 [Peronosclerospora sorghi]|uniref:Uncharacterized protein n=1 Tax=Peronosclerospora sorghi TaxID=230839 RepID=A0ACC0W7N0_9STRA|nr:hypothetical protein PsorP6_007927 [Peronosclerospora sorghi]